MKKLTAFLLALVCIVTFVNGCSFPFGSDEPAFTEDDMDAVADVKKAVESSQAVREDLIDLIKQQIIDSEEFVTGYAAATDAGDIYDATYFNDQINGNQLTIEEYSDDIEKLLDDVEKIRKPDAKEVVLTIEAAEVYFAKLLSCISDLDSVMTFYVDETVATGPIYAFNADDYGNDTFGMIDGLYVAIEDTIDNFQTLTSCPVYMQESFDIYIDKVSVYLKMLEAWYYGYMLDDPLRVYSGDQLFARQNIEVVNYEVELYGMIDLQYLKVEDRLQGSIKTLQDEILDNCNAIKKADNDAPKVSYSYLDAEPEVTVEYIYADTIYPSLYSSMDSVINITATSENGEAEVLVKVEIPGFTQEYQQKMTITEQVTMLLVKPVILTENLNLESSKDAQLRVSITDLDSDKTILEESKTISLMSVYDFMLTDDEFGVTSRDNVLAWLTPESDGILELRRNAITWLYDWSEGQIDSLIGYQDYGLFEDPSLNVYIQIMALQGAISDMGVRYNMGAFSLAEGANQRVLLPDNVLESGSGICIETAILMATAIQSADMHAMILFVPGHAQVAVETGYGTGSYFLVETTTLPFSGSDDDMYYLITEFTNEEWGIYLADPWGNGSGSAYVVDCDLVQSLGIKTLGYTS